MPYISPDLAGFYGPEDTIYQALQQQQSPDQPSPDQQGQTPGQDLMSQLAARGMDRGLSYNAVRDQPTYSGPTAGYNGPMRASDVPMRQIQPLMPAQQALQVDQLRATPSPIPGFANMYDALPMLQSIQKLHPDAQAAVLKKMGLPVMTDVEKEMAVARGKYDLAAPDRQAAQADRKANVQISQNRLEEQRLQNEERNRTPYDKMITTLKDAWDANIRDPKILATIARGGGWYYQGGTSEGTFKSPLSGELSPRIGTTPMYQGAPEQAPNLPKRGMEGGRTGQAPAQAAPAQSAQPSQGQKRPLSREEKMTFLRAAGGDIAKAKKMAADAGYSAE